MEDRAFADLTGVALNLVVALTITLLGTGSDRYSAPTSFVLPALLVVGLLALAARHAKAVPRTLQLESNELEPLVQRPRP
jgi:hypothetical protein